MTRFGHYHFNVTDARGHLKFFVDAVGGTPARISDVEDAVVRFPNALIFLRERPPAGGTKGTTVSHVAFGVPDIRRMVAAVASAGFPLVTRAEVHANLEVKDDLCYMADQATFIAFTMAPDEAKIEFIEIPSQAHPVTLHHIHFAGPSVPDMKAWYVSAFDAKPGKRGNFEAADLPCVNLTYSPSPAPVVGTRGRTLDRIGFEVDDMDALCRRLETLGTAVERQAVSGRQAAFVTDPWGTVIELTQGLV